MKKYRGIIILVLTIIFNIIETIYFGCNKIALTPPEVICDGVTIIGIFVGIFFMSFDWIDKFYNKMKNLINNKN